MNIYTTTRILLIATTFALMGHQVHGLSISRISPELGTIGSTVDIEGGGFIENVPGALDLKVAFRSASGRNDLYAAYSRISSTRLRATVPAGAMTGKIYLYKTTILGTTYARSGETFVPDVPGRVRFVNNSSYSISQAGGGTHIWFDGPRVIGHGDVYEFDGNPGLYQMWLKFVDPTGSGDAFKKYDMFYHGSSMQTFYIDSPKAHEILANCNESQTYHWTGNSTRYVEAIKFEKSGYWRVYEGGVLQESGWIEHIEYVQSSIRIGWTDQNNSYARFRLNSTGPTYRVYVCQGRVVRESDQRTWTIP